MVSRCSRSACVVCAGRRGPVRRAGAPRRRSPALRLPGDAAVAFQRSGRSLSREGVADLSGVLAANF